MALGNLASRVLVAIVAAPILILAMYQDRPEFTWGLVFAASLLGMYEFFAMTLEDKADRVFSLVAGAGAAACLYWIEPRYSGPTIAMFAAVIPIALYYLFRFRDMSTAGARFAYSITGVVYVGLMFTFLALLRRDFELAEGDLVLFVLVVAWLGDTGAYFAGRFLGKHSPKLYEAVSPKKTWAGAIGGIAGSAAGAAGVKLIAEMDYMPWFDVFAMAIPAAALGQMGDLVESLIKRSTGVKDSGSILPGHGGILDRVDAVLFIAPYVYLYLQVRPHLS